MFQLPLLEVKVYAVLHVIGAEVVSDCVYVWAPKVTVGTLVDGPILKVLLHDMASHLDFLNMHKATPGTAYDLKHFATENISTR